jgi:NodT family efflux transporter outer membrane factor (OMF) lipoprotein
MNNFRSSVQRGACLAVIMAMLGGCAVGPDFVRPAPPDADRYTSKPPPEATVAADGQAQHFTPGAAITADWWRLFKSAQLDAVVRQAIANNPTLQAAEASLRQSQDNLRAGYGVFFPQGQAGLSASRQRTAPLQQGSQTSGTDFQSGYCERHHVSYALDVFGGKRRTVEGLRAQADYQRYESKAAYLTLSANVVNTSIARAAYAAQIRATEQLIDLENQQLHLAEAQVRAGTAPYSNVLSVRSLIAANQALLAPLEQNVSHAEHLLATLEGVVPSKATLPDIDLTGLSLPMRPAGEPAVRPGAPASRHPVGRGTDACGQRQHRRRDRRDVPQLQLERHLRWRQHHSRQSFGGQPSSGVSARRPRLQCFRATVCGTSGERPSTPTSSRRQLIDRPCWAPSSKSLTP